MVENTPDPRTIDHLAGDATLTQLLARWSQGDAWAEACLFQAVYSSLERIAANALRAEAGSATLDTHDLLQESYLVLSKQRTAWVNRAQFFAAAARVVRRILIDHARKKRRRRRGSGAPHVDLDQVPLVADDEALLAVDQAVVELARLDGSAARLVELRYFGGLSIEECAGVLGCGRSTAVRTWRFARAWLQHQLTAG